MNPQKIIDANYRVFGKLALYVPMTGEPIPVRVIIDQQDDVAVFNGNRIRSDKNIFNIRATEIPSPARQDVIVLDGVSYIIKDTPVPLDPERLEWQLECVRG